MRQRTQDCGGGSSTGTVHEDSNMLHFVGGSSAITTIVQDNLSDSSDEDTDLPLGPIMIGTP